MNRNIRNNFVIPLASIHTFSAIGMIIYVTAYEKIFVLALKKATGNEQGIKILQRIDIGMVFSIIAMAIVALVERKRLREVERDCQSRESRLSVYERVLVSSSVHHSWDWRWVCTCWPTRILL
ncbi:Protein NRT1/ PTR FAMILY 5.7 [Camellia lanceoleosa]|uniref:Protein NRT1/ PTR FAMILY 5.7 n=1 Tax=Camellia lanceoleosa TaxID=1840588 RepID=A0ACC0FNV5_9ERIC|nr:Protein NRT1/ PTR FAMILY 5.7 [Camellia lanceoleosa]